MASISASPMLWGFGGPGYDLCVWLNTSPLLHCPGEQPAILRRLAEIRVPGMPGSTLRALRIDEIPTLCDVTPNLLWIPLEEPPRGTAFPRQGLPQSYILCNLCTHLFGDSHFPWQRLAVPTALLACPHPPPRWCPLRRLHSLCYWWATPKQTTWFREPMSPSILQSV